MAGRGQHGKLHRAQGLGSGGQAMAGAVYDLANDASLIAEVKKEFMVRRGGKAYCSIEKLFD
ncbi:hypothetical protein [Bilophila wadsworthia]|uniref:hypothetical protein n=1 Tax=Bilophila wadsworthia TaxID=35833 RepID=UPI001D0B011F|nr:hypothetical protein [Bilophila wadsworthia]MCB8571928.1 hypothetical protein [Bilophila wadsworthia]MCG4633351.1 hypothetical protein [Bilophila wadsworthia]